MAHTLRLYKIIYPAGGKQFVAVTSNVGGPGSSVGIATAYGLDGPGIESR
jgi:hypothetical protein